MNASEQFNGSQRVLAGDTTCVTPVFKPGATDKTVRCYTPVNTKDKGLFIAIADAAAASATGGVIDQIRAAGGVRNLDGSVPGGSGEEDLGTTSGGIRFDSSVTGNVSFTSREGYRTEYAVDMRTTPVQLKKEAVSPQESYERITFGYGWTVTARNLSGNFQYRPAELGLKLGFAYPRTSGACKLKQATGVNEFADFVSILGKGQYCLVTLNEIAPEVSFEEQGQNTVTAANVEAENPDPDSEVFESAEKFAAGSLAKLSAELRSPAFRMIYAETDTDAGVTFQSARCQVPFLKAGTSVADKTEIAVLTSDRAMCETLGGKFVARSSS